MTVSLTYEPGRAAFAGPRRGRGGARPLAERVLELPALDEHYAPTSRAAPAPPRAVRCSSRGRRARSIPAPAVALLEAGGERAEAELVAGQVLALLRAGVRGGEIVVVYRSRAPGRARCSSASSPSTGSRSAAGRELPLPHTPLGRALRGRGALRAGSTSARLAPRTCSTICARPGVLDHPEVADGLEARRAPRGAADSRRRRSRAARVGAGRARRAGRRQPTRRAQLCALGAPAVRRSPSRRGAGAERRARSSTPRALATLLRAARRSSPSSVEPPVRARELVALLRRSWSRRAARPVARQR